jgi:RNA polymerase sigma factor (sigma-70 family)
VGSGPLTSVLRHLHRLLGAPRSEALDDAQLLQRFAHEQDQGAFTALVQRHGPLVWGVCRRVLGHEQDVEDAFQATFLVLARKAASIRRPEALGAWLYGVAYHIALKARAAAARRRQREREAGAMPRPEGSDEQLRQELRQVLDEELHRLPSRYRRLLVLCDLQGRTHLEAARELGLAPGSVSRHLARGRDLLRERLVRRGITLSAALLATYLAGEAAAAPPAALLAPTVEAAVSFLSGGAAPSQAAALAKGALNTMFLTKVRFTALVLLAGLAVAGAGYAAHRALSPAPARPGPEAEPAPLADEAPPPTRTDRRGDSLPAGALARLGTERFRLGGWGECVLFTADGRRLISRDSGRGPRLWEVSTGRPLGQFSLPGNQRVGAVALSPDDQALAVAGSDGTINLLDFHTGKSIQRFVGHAEEVSALAFSPDGKLLASGRDFDYPRKHGQDNPIQLWDVATGKELRLLVGHKDAVMSMAFSPDGKALASGGQRYDAVLRLWDVATGDELFALKGHGGEVRSVAFSPDGKTVASGSMDKTIRLWDPMTGKEKGRLTGHTEDVMAVAFSPDGKLLASGSFDRTVRLWNPATSKQLWQAEEDEAGNASTLTSSSRFRINRGITAVAFSPDGKAVATAGRDHTLHLFDVASGSEVRPFRGQFDAVDAVAFSPDGDRVWTIAGDRNLRLWETTTGKEVRSLETSAGLPLCVAFSAEGRLAATGGEQDHAAHIWDLATGKELQRFLTPDVIGALAFSPDGRTLATANRWQRAEVSLWDLGRGKLLRRLPAPAEQGNTVVSLAFTPDGRTLTGATYDGMVVFWDPTTGAECLPPLKHFEHCQRAVLSPDGRTLAVGNMNGTVCLYEMATGRERRRCRGYPFCFSPDGRLFATGRDHAIAVWDLAEDREVGRLTGHNGDIRGLAFAPDGTRLVSGSEDTTALVWEVNGLRRRQLVREGLTAPKLDRLWNELSSGDASAAYRAQWALALAPRQAVPFLAQKVRPAAPADGRLVAQLLADLDSEDFAVRQRADEGLKKLGDSAEPALRRALGGSVAPEVRRRVEACLERPRQPSPESLRRLRALEALERIGSREARAVVERLAREAPATRTGEAAKDTLRRLAERGPPPR